MSQGPTYRSADPKSLLLDFEGDLRDIDAYERHDGYQALLGPGLGTFEAIVDELKASNLRGRGGAGFPTGLKVSFIGKPEPRFLVVNADESEPGTFKDRELMLRNPHALIEGCLILCHAIGSHAAYIYIRGEYATEAEVLEAAIAQARTRGYVGAPIKGTGEGDKGYAIEIYVHRGAGAYICGEETALLSSLNGQRGQPTAKPPFPAVAGAWAKPTLLNNVETVATVPAILRLGGAKYGEIGPEKAKGTRLFSLSGNVQRPGNFEIPTMAMTYRDIIEGLGGGALEGHEIKAFVPGGASAPLLPASMLDTGLSYDAIAAAGSMSGSGAIIVLDERVCMVQFALRTAQFFRHESCGKCTPCREGTRWTVETLLRIEAGDATMDELDLLLSICDNIEGKCLCPLGDSCAMAVRGNIKYFRAEFERHITEGCCPFHGTSPMSDLYPQPPRRLLPMLELHA